MKPSTLAQIADAKGRWWVGHTKSRSEKAFAWDLHTLGIDYFLPLVPRTTFSGGRKRKGLIPLFSSYVFFNGDGDARLRAFATDRICNAIDVPDQAELVTELTTIERALQGEVPLDLYPFAVEGRRVKVVTGPMEGVTGTIISRDGITTLIIRIDVLAQNVGMPIPADFVIPMDDEDQ